VYAKSSTVSDQVRERLQATSSAGTMSWWRAVERRWGTTIPSNHERHSKHSRLGRFKSGRL